MHHEQALVPSLLIQRGNKILENILSVLLGIAGLSVLAQIAIPLPWTPVPVTGQTFGVAMVALLWGRKRASAAILGYLVLGAAGAPVFALGNSGLSLGPTLGYLVGMAIAAIWMGFLSDLGWTKKFWKTYVVAFSGSVITFTCGVIGLSFFIPSNELWVAGVLPFLPGDFIKTLLASFLVQRAQR